MFFTISPIKFSLIGILVLTAISVKAETPSVSNTSMAVASASSITLPSISDRDCNSKTDCYQLKPTGFEHIQFGRIPANKVSIEQDTITLNVVNSASFLMHGFDDVMSVKQVSFNWKSQGKPVIASANEEREVGGDDAVVKLGLLLRAERKPFKPFLPDWMERVEENLKYPSTNMLYLVADSRNESGERWLSPYNDRVTMISMQNGMTPDGWYHSNVEFDEPVEVVGVWLMSDGDDTQSSFTTSIKDIVLR